MGVDEKPDESVPVGNDCKPNGSDLKPTSSDADISDLEVKIIKQLEYYFGDCNLASDKFMQQQIKLDDGWISLEVLIKFNRLKTLSTDYDVIVKAVRKSASNLIEVSEDQQKLRRNPDKPLPEKSPDHMTAVIARSVYVKGFPQDSTLDQLLEFFKGKGNILKIHMRKNPNKKMFKGSIFLTFASPEEAQEFMKEDCMRYRNKDLLRELSVDYHARKNVEFKARIEERQKKKEKREQGEGEGEEGSKVEAKGCVLKLSGLGGKTTWEAIRKVFEEHADISFVDFSRGDREGLVRFKDEGGAQKAVDATCGVASDPKTVTIEDNEVQMRVLEGEEEEEYWKELKKKKEELIKRRMQSRRGRGPFRGRGRGHKRSHDGHRDRSERSSKASKSD